MTEQEKEAAVKHSFEYWKATVRDVNREFFNEQLDQYGNVKALEKKLRERDAEIKELRECVRVLSSALKYYADVAKDDLEPKPEKAHLYDQDYPMSHPLWRQRSMSDYIGGKRARAVLKDHAETIERCL